MSVPFHASIVTFHHGSTAAGVPGPRARRRYPRPSCSARAA
jgi:hypothetical protein